jgi:hypothetical protein
MLRRVTLSLIGISFLAYLIVFGREGLKPAAFFFPFTMLPYLITLLLVLRFPSQAAQIALLITTLAYSTWFVFLYLDVTVWHPDPQSPIAFLFVGIYAAPVLIFCWLLACVLEWYIRSNEPSHSSL